MRLVVQECGLRIRQLQISDLTIDDEPYIVWSITQESEVDFID